MDTFKDIYKLTPLAHRLLQSKVHRPFSTFYTTRTNTSSGNILSSKSLWDKRPCIIARRTSNAY